MKSELLKRYDSLPSDYLMYIESTKEPILQRGEIYFIFLSKEEALELNEDLEALEYFPKFLFIGKDELSNAIAYNVCNSRFYFVPMEGDEEDAIEIAENFTELTAKVENEKLKLY